jgi:hypothetical protein
MEMAVSAKVIAVIVHPMMNTGFRSKAAISEMKLSQVLGKDLILWLEGNLRYVWIVLTRILWAAAN